MITNKTEEKRLPAVWEIFTGITIIDPDGWDRSNPDDWYTPITQKEFEEKACRSTIQLRCKC